MSLNFPLEIINGEQVTLTSGGIVRRINCGSSLEITVDGNGDPIGDPNHYWKADGGNATSSGGGSIWYNWKEGVAQGFAVSQTVSKDSTVDDYVPLTVLKSERYQSPGFSLDYQIPAIDTPNAVSSGAEEDPLSNGTYRVNLFWSDNWGANRVFDIVINGVKVVDDFVEHASGNATYVGQMLSFDVEVNTGVIEISCTREIENPKLHAIEVIKLETISDTNEFVRIEEPSNLSDTDTGNYGAVPYVYDIGKYEVTRKNIDSYNSNNPTRVITMANVVGDDKPASGITWNEAARYVNWLNANEGYHVAYRFSSDGVNDDAVLWSSADSWQLGGENRFRHRGTKYFLPSEDEWYKAAYYDPINGLYYNYPTGSDVAPTAVSSGTTFGTAVYLDAIEQTVVYSAGGLSPYGTMGQGGNVWEWMESEVDGVNDQTSSSRTIRGGAYGSDANEISVNTRISKSPTLTHLTDGTGFRVAKNPFATVHIDYEKQFVVVGDVNNVGDTEHDGYGSVSYEYDIAKFELAEEQIDVYNLENSTAPINKDTRGGSKPATSISWNEAARYVNWLNTREGYQEAYNFSSVAREEVLGISDNIQLWGVDQSWQLGGENRFRHKDARYFLPSEDEWYKAAYYDPNKDGSGGYWNYPVALDDNVVSTSGGEVQNTAVYSQAGPADVIFAGGLSPYGTMGQGGNAYEWMESELDGTNNDPSAFRTLRGGEWAQAISAMASTARTASSPNGTSSSFSFRVAGNPNAFPVTTSYVSIGDSNNAADTDVGNYGAVSNDYKIGKFEVTEKEIDAYNLSSLNASKQITISDRGDNKPATNITWLECARFANWLNINEGYQAAYNFSDDSITTANSLWPVSDSWSTSNRFRHKDAKYFLPSEDEWYKAAYYDPDKDVTGGYYLYPTGSDVAPTAVSTGTGPETAVYNGQGDVSDVFTSGGLSPYGTMGQGGNAYEWLESAFDGDNNSSGEPRVLRGGGFVDNSLTLQSSNRISLTDFEGIVIGFRVAMNPEKDTPTVFYDTNIDVIATYSGNIPFEYNKDSVLYSNIDRIEIGGSTLELGIGSFSNNTSVTSLDLGSTLQLIGDSSFSGCSGISNSIAIPNSVTSIGSNSFLDCSSLSGLSIGNNVTNIGLAAFNQCTNIQGSITLPDGLLYIKQNAFYNCNSISGALDIPNTVTTLGESAFNRCASLTSLSLPDNATLDTILGGSFYGCTSMSGALIIPNNIKSLGASAFGGGCGFTSLTLSNTLESIGDACFSGANSFSGALTIPDTVLTIGNNSFWQTTFNGALTIGNSVSSIDERAFKDCQVSGALSLPSSVITIGPNAFENCTSLDSITLPDNTSYTSISQQTFNGCSGLTGTLTIPDHVTSIGLEAFKNCSSLSTLEIPPNTIVVIGANAFSGTTLLTEANLYVPKSVIDNSDANCFASSGLTTIYVRSNDNTWDDTINPQTVGGKSGITVVKSLGSFATPSELLDISSNTLASITTDIPSNWNDDNTPFSGATTLKVGTSCETIGSEAFLNCTELTTLDSDLPDSVITIGNSSFQNTINLTSQLTLPNSVGTIGDFAFSASGITGPLTLGNGVETIGDQAFIYCDSLTGALTIPDSVETIGEYAFGSCTGFTGSLVLGNGVTTIAKRAFNDCAGFTGALVIPDNFTGRIGSYAFGQCTDFDSLTLGNGVSIIGGRAFNDCTGLTGSLAIPDSVLTIEDNAFRNCSGLNGSLTIGNGVSGIGVEAFRDCSGLTGSLTIPNNVTSIGSNAFRDCSGFTGSLTIPNSLTSIEINAFGYCSGLTGSLNIPNTVETIRGSAFYSCAGFTGALTIPNNVTSIGSNAFRDCSGFDGSLTIPSGVTTIEFEAFRGCSGLTGSLTIPNSVTTNIGDRAFRGCSGLTGSLTISNIVETIRNGAFQGCSGLTGALTIPNSVVELDEYAFQGCTSFSGALTIPDSVTSMGTSAFQDCSGFDGSLTLPNNVSFTTLSTNIFYNCSGLTGVLTIPNSVTDLLEGVFGFCSGFTGALTIPNSVSSIGNRAFRNCTGFTGSLAIPDSVATIGDGAFFACSNFDGALTLPNNVNFTSIGSQAFKDCSGLTGALTIPNSVTNLSSQAFYGCSGLTGALTIPNNVTSIGSSAFRDCTGFAGSLTLPNNVNFTSISSEAFYNCSGLTGSLTIPNSVEVVEGNSFYNCSGLTGTLTIGNSVASIGYGCFQNCDFSSISFESNSSLTTLSGRVFLGNESITSFNIPASVTSLESDMLRRCHSLTTLTVDAGNTNYTSVNNVIFNSNLTTLFIYPAGVSGSYTVPSTVTELSPDCFSNSKLLTSVTLPDGILLVTGLGECEELTSINFPDSVTTINSWSFLNCSKLAGTLTIPPLVTTLLGGTFWGCSSLTALELPTSITSISSTSFTNCTGITTVDCYTTKGVLDQNSCLSSTGVTTINVRTTDTTFDDTINPQTVGGKSGVTVNKTLTG